MHIASPHSIAQPRAGCRAHRCLLALLSIAAAPGVIAQSPSVDFSAVVHLIQSQDDAVYVGGMSPVMQEAAATLRRNTEQVLGHTLPTCTPPETANGRLVANLAESQQRIAPVAGLDGMTTLIAALKSERIAVRDSAAYLLAELGPIAAPALRNLDADSTARSTWSAHALGHISCNLHSLSASANHLPPAVRERLQLTGIGPEQTRHQQQLHAVETLLQDRQLIWPDDLFSYWLTEESEQQIDPATLIAVARIVADEKRPLALRTDVATLLTQLGAASAPAGDVLWPAAQRALDRGDAVLAGEIGVVLMNGRGQHGTQAAIWMLQHELLSLAWSGKELCTLDHKDFALADILVDRLRGDHWEEAQGAAELIGCLGLSTGKTELLRVAMQHPSWSVQLAAVRALQQPTLSDETSRHQLAQLATSHWSGMVRDAARDAANGVALQSQDSPDSSTVVVFPPCFHRCFVDHRNDTCATDAIRDGNFALQSTGLFPVHWQRSSRQPAPAGFPLSLQQDSREDYGTNTFLRVEDGWLFGTDRWHYDGQAAFVSDSGHVQALSKWGADAIAMLNTPHFGRIMIGQSLFRLGDTAALSQLTRSANGQWTAKPVVLLPSEPDAWAFAPDGTLLVADTLNAVAVHSDGSLENLRCPGVADTVTAVGATTLLELAHGRHQHLPIARFVTARETPKSQRRELQQHKQRWLKAAGQLPSASDNKGQAELKHSQTLLAASYAQLGISLDLLGRPGKSLAASREALRLQPENHDYAVEVADALNAVQRYAEADQQWSLIIDRAATPLKLQRAAFQHLAAARFEQALALAAKIDPKEMSRSERSYAAVTVVLAAEALKRDPAQLLQQLGYAPDRNNLLWPDAAIEMLRGQLSTAQLMLHLYSDLGVDRERLCEVLYFRGLQLEIAGDAEDARRYYQAAERTQVVDFAEYRAARRGLQRLATRKASNTNHQ